MIDFIQNLFKKGEPTLTADQARNLLDFGRMGETLDMAAVKEIRIIEERVKRNSEYGKRVITSVVSNNLLPVSKKVIAHFKKMGFFVDLYDKDEVKDSHIIIISW